LFVEDPVVRAFLKKSKAQICATVSRHTGYSVGDIALIPEVISPGDAELAENLLPLELVIDTGIKCAGMTTRCGELIKHTMLTEINGAKDLHFGIWLRSSDDNHYTEHKPE
jgi:hypothetical protein